MWCVCSARRHRTANLLRVQSSSSATVRRHSPSSHNVLPISIRPSVRPSFSWSWIWEKITREGQQMIRNDRWDSTDEEFHQKKRAIRQKTWRKTTNYDKDQKKKENKKSEHRWERAGKWERKKLIDVLLVPGNDVCDHPVCDAWTHVFGQSDVAFQLLDGQSLLRVLLVLLLQLQKKKTTMKGLRGHVLCVVCRDLTDLTSVWARFRHSSFPPYVPAVVQILLHSTFVGVQPFKSNVLIDLI